MENHNILRSEAEEIPTERFTSDKAKLKEVTVYTDGACSGNPGPGGWGAVLIYKDKQRELCGYEDVTTNNRMELKAAIEALSALKGKCHVMLFSDSAYLVDAFGKGWVQTWRRKGWRLGDGKEVKNSDLWRALLDLNGKHEIRFIKVKGHSDNYYNNRCDKLATECIKTHSLNR